MWYDRSWYACNPGSVSYAPCYPICLSRSRCRIVGTRLTVRRVCSQVMWTNSIGVTAPDKRLPIPRAGFYQHLMRVYQPHLSVILPAYQCSDAGLSCLQMRMIEKLRVNQNHKALCIAYLASAHLSPTISLHARFVLGSWSSYAIAPLVQDGQNVLEQRRMRNPCMAVGQHNRKPRVRGCVYSLHSCLKCDDVDLAASIYTSPDLTDALV